MKVLRAQECREVSLEEAVALPEQALVTVVGTLKRAPVVRDSGTLRLLFLELWGDAGGTLKVAVKRDDLPRYWLFPRFFDVLLRALALCKMH